MTVLFMVSLSGGVADDAAPLRIVPPDGWTATDSVQLYGTADNPGPDGTIYDYMNGGGLVYLDHGFVRLHHRSCIGPDDVRLTIDVFDLGSSAHAVDAFDDYAVCPPDPISCDIGIPCKLYEFPPDLLLYARTGRFLLSVHVSDTTCRKELIEYTRHLASTLSGG